MSEASLVTRFSSTGASELLRNLQDITQQGDKATKASETAAKTIAVMLRQEASGYASKASIIKSMAAEEVAASRVSAAAARDRIAAINEENAATRARISLLREAKAQESADKAGSFWESSTAKAGLYLNALNSAISLTSRLFKFGESFVNEAAKWEQMDMALKDMEGSAGGAATATEHLYEIAKAPAIEMATAQHAYLQLRALRMEAPQAERVITNFSNTIALSGGGSQQFEGVLRQLVQMESKGRVLTQDLRIMQEHMPRLTSLMRDAFGETTAEGIRKAGINAKQFVEGLLEQMDKLPRATQTLQSSIENTSVAYSRFKSAFVDTDTTKNWLDGWTSVFERMTVLLKAKSVDWSEMIRQAMSGGDISKAAINTESDQKAKAIRDFHAKANIEFGNRTAGQTAREIFLGKGGLPAVLSSRSQSTPDEFVASAKRTFGGNLPTGLEDRLRKMKTSSAAQTLVETEYANLLKQGGFGDQDRTIVTGQTIPPGGITPGKADLTAGKKSHEQIQRENLAKTLAGLEEENKIQARYNAIKGDLEQQGIDKSIINAIVDRNKAVDEVDKKYHALYADAKKYGGDVLEVDRLHEEARYEAFVKGNDKVIAAQEEFDRKSLAEKDARAVKEKEIQDRIDKAREATSEQYQKEEDERHRRATEIEESYRTELEILIESEDAKLNALNKAGRLTIELENKIRTEREKGERAYYTKNLSLFTSGASQMFSAMAETAKNAAGEMSTTYKTMFAISKGFAIADASIKLASAALDALSDKTQPSTIVRLGQMGTILAAGGTLISEINSTAYSGVFDKGGYIPSGSWGIAGENGPEVVQGPAHVTSTRDTARLMAGGQSSGVQVAIHNYAGVAVEARPNDEGGIDVMIQKIVDHAETKIAHGIATGSGKVSTTMAQTFNLKRGR